MAAVPLPRDNMGINKEQEYLSMDGQILPERSASPTRTLRSPGSPTVKFSGTRPKTSQLENRPRSKSMSALVQNPLTHQWENPFTSKRFVLPSIRGGRDQPNRRKSSPATKIKSTYNRNIGGNFSAPTSPILQPRCTEIFGTRLPEVHLLSRF